MRQNPYKCHFTLHNNLARDIFIDVNEDKELIADIIDNDTLEDAVDDQGNKVSSLLMTQVRLAGSILQKGLLTRDDRLIAVMYLDTAISHNG